ncbi:MAG TPA: GNAT family N-acetyltransferase, partial [Aggregatilineales bacterium]|nr:GNAT family N-acetyltransferase [Aggregatilineales bacterium]
MAARVLAGATLPLRGLRPVNLRTDLIQMADLIELCFGPTMTEAGRASLREMRMIGGSDWLSWLLYGADRALGGLEEGFVWVEDDKIVGNVSLSPANYPRSEGRGFIIANVAVHPNYRRRGLAQAMVLACLDLAHRKDGTFAILQVEASNDGARKLYEKVGFRAERAFIQWRHGPQISPLTRLAVTPTITLRQGGQ